MKICGISDLHGTLPEIPECDVLCIAGDIVSLTIQRDSTESDKWWTINFTNWVNDLNCKKVVVVPGNHDFYLERLYNGLDKDFTLQQFKDKMSLLTDDKVVILIDELYEYEGVTFYGTPWIAPIYYQSWAFEDYESKYEYECPYEKMPRCDILITHENPNYNEKLDHCCFGKYKHHLFGHWHDGISYGYLNQHNCSILNDNYNTRRIPRVVTINYNKDDED